MRIEAGLSEGQVLQRLAAKGATVKIEGTAKEAGSVFATISKGRVKLSGWKKRRVGESSQGSFTARLSALPAGGPYRLELRVGQDSVGVDHFFVGDVWILAGQSNMEGCGDLTFPAKPHPLIRSFGMSREWGLATDPLHLPAESPDVCHSGGKPATKAAIRQLRRNAKKGVGPGIFFAREMLKRSSVPQGLICTAHGGTSLKQWDPRLKSERGKSLYGSMLLSLRATRQPVSGMLWYQGETDAVEGPHLVYTARMKKLVASVSRDLKQPALPWIMVQLGRVHGYVDKRAAWNSVQEQQRLLPHLIPGLETVAAIDLPLDDNIHISSLGNARLGLRLARAASRLVHGDKKEKPAPQLQSIHLPKLNKKSFLTTGSIIDVAYKGIEGGLQAGGEPWGFTLVDLEGNSLPDVYKVDLRGNVARLFLSQPIIGRVNLHYGYGLTPICTITDGRDMSLPVFGPLPVGKSHVYLPFIKTWKVTQLRPGTVPLGKLSRPQIQKVGNTTKTYEDGFINQHSDWQGKKGQCYFSSWLHLPEAMKLRFLLGYDGPFRLWLNEEAFYRDLHGTNPCLCDQYKKDVFLQAGSHRVTVAMDINQGLAWGFMLRLVRLDVSEAKLRDRSIILPRYSVEKN